MAEVFYRKWRPKSLSEVVGQEAITKTLKQAVAQGRVAHAYLFCGTRGTGKTSTARILAKAINCLSPQDGEPDNECHICVGINEFRALDLIEIDAASNRGIDDIRDLSDKVRFSPNESSRKIYIIDEVHMLTEPAFNALLKTLEEPPAHAVFILATTEAHKVPPTIISRCQRFDFRRIPIEQMVAKLSDICAQEGIEASDGALRTVSRIANGGLRDAENILEQVFVSYGSPVDEENVRNLLGLGGDEMAMELVVHIIGKSVSEGITAINSASEQGNDLRQLLRGALEYLRSLLLIKTGAGVQFGYSDEIAERLNTLAADTQMEHLYHALKVFAGVNMRRDSASTLPLELAMVESAMQRERVQAVTVSAPRGDEAPQAAPLGYISPAPPPQSQPYPRPQRQSRPQPPARPTGAPIGAPADAPSTADEDTPTQPAARLEHQWRAITWDLRHVGARFMLGALLNSCKEREVADDTIVLKFAHRSNMERIQEELDNPESRRALNDALVKAMGSSYRVNVSLVNDGNGSGTQPASQRSHLVLAAQSMGARIVSEKEEEQL